LSLKLFAFDEKVRKRKFHVDCKVHSRVTDPVAVPQYNSFYTVVVL